MNQVNLSRTALNKKCGLTAKQWTRYHDSIIAYLSEYFKVFEEHKTEGNLYYYVIGYDNEWPEIPKFSIRSFNKQQREQDYEDFVKDNLPREFAPESKARLSRVAIKEFGNKKYRHGNYQSVAKCYVGPAMEKFGEKSGVKVWVNYKTYIKLDEKQREFLKECFERYDLPEAKRAKILDQICSAIQNGETNVQSLIPLNTYQQVLDAFKQRYDFIPIVVDEWRAKEAAW